MPISFEEVTAYLSETGRSNELSNFTKQDGAFSLVPRYWLELLDPLHHEGKFLERMLDKFRAKNPTSTLSDFFTFLASYELTKRLEYEKKPENKIMFDERHNVLKTADGKLLDTRHAKGRLPGFYAVARDLDGDFYAAEHIANQRQHSSLVAGEPVYFAGYIQIEQGKVINLINYSGHYQAGDEVLLKTAAQFFGYGREEGVPVTYFSEYKSRDRHLKLFPEASKEKRKAIATRARHLVSPEPKKEESPRLKRSLSALLIRRKQQAGKPVEAKPVPVSEVNFRVSTIG